MFAARSSIVLVVLQMIEVRLLVIVQAAERCAHSGNMRRVGAHTVERVVAAMPRGTKHAVDGGEVGRQLSARKQLMFAAFAMAGLAI
jgi:hypothetical protein